MKPPSRRQQIAPWLILALWGAILLSPLGHGARVDLGPIWIGLDLPALYRAFGP